MKKSSFPTMKLLLIRPAAFGSNPETLANNTFQKESSENDVEISKMAVDEFDNMVKELLDKNFDLKVFQEPDNQNSPDTIFPNNWFSTNNDKSCVLYPMYSIQRRGERRAEFIDGIKNFGEYTNIFDLSDYENNNVFLEGTGSIVFDHHNKKAYCSGSVRSDEGLFNKLCQKLNYVPYYFHSSSSGVPVYHTNVLMAMGVHTVVICSEIINTKDFEVLQNSFENDGKKILDISEDQMKSFVGNMLLAKNSENKSFWLMSKTAFDSLKHEQKLMLEEEGDLLYFNIPTIEEYGGGSVRCMLAEIY